MDVSLSQSNSSFLGETVDDAAGVSSPAGDVNGDGFDDFLIHSWSNDQGGTDAGKVYLILGGSWTESAMDTSLSQANASFIGEAAGDVLASFDENSGDINGDGFTDIILNAHGNDEGGTNAGQTYLFFGGSGLTWGPDTPMSDANASWIGEAAEDRSGFIVSVANVNGDLYDDVLITATGCELIALVWQCNGVGKMYLIMGAPTGQVAMDTSLSTANTTFTGEQSKDWFGWSTRPIGDINNDGNDDFAIGALDYDNGATNNTGRVYVVIYPFGVPPPVTTTTTTTTSTTTNTTTSTTSTTSSTESSTSTTTSKSTTPPSSSSESDSPVLTYQILLVAGIATVYVSRKRK